MPPPRRCSSGTSRSAHPIRLRGSRSWPSMGRSPWLSVSNCLRHLRAESASPVPLSALHPADQAIVQFVDVASEAEDSVVAGPGGPVADVNRHGLGQRHLLLFAGVEPLADHFGSPFGIVLQSPDRQIERIFDPHAAMAQGAELAAE